MEPDRFTACDIYYGFGLHSLSDVWFAILIAKIRRLLDDLPLRAPTIKIRAMPSLERVPIGCPFLTPVGVAIHMSTDQQHRQRTRGLPPCWFARWARWRLPTRNRHINSSAWAASGKALLGTLNNDAHLASNRHAQP
jgi:hypothetical protein